MPKDLPASPAVGTKSYPWIWDGEKWSTETTPTDAPRNGIPYARKNGVWVPTIRRERPVIAGQSSVIIDVPPEAKMFRWRYAVQPSDATSNFVMFSLDCGLGFKEAADDYYVSGNWHATSPSSQFTRQAPAAGPAMYMTWTQNNNTYQAFSRGHMNLEIVDPTKQRYVSFFDIEVYHATSGIFNMIGHNFSAYDTFGATEKRVQRMRVFFYASPTKFNNNGLALEWIC